MFSFETAAAAVGVSLVGVSIIVVTPTLAMLNDGIPDAGNYKLEKLVFGSYRLSTHLG